MTGAARKLARHLPIASTLCVKFLWGIAKDKVRGAKVRAISFAKTVLLWPGSDPAIQGEFLGCPDFCSSYPVLR